MRDQVIEHLRTTMQSQAELAESLPDDAFSKKLNHRSNTIGSQYWCVVGARESYGRALKQGQWSGFACSMTGQDTLDRPKGVLSLNRAAQAIEETLDGLEWTADRDNILLNLLEHETQHQGQLIRYVYALGYTFPKSWADRWALSE